MRKKAITEKERSSHWNKEIKTVRKIETKLGQKYYILDGDTVGYLRHELLKVYRFENHEISENDHENFRKRPRKFPKTTTKISENDHENFREHQHNSVFFHFSEGFFSFQRGCFFLKNGVFFFEKRVVFFSINSDCFF